MHVLYHYNVCSLLFIILFSYRVKKFNKSYSLLFYVFLLLNNTPLSVLCTLLLLCAILFIIFGEDRVEFATMQDHVVAVCSVLVWIRQFAVVWVCLARKGRFIPDVFCHRGCGIWICSCWRDVHSPLHTLANACTSFFLLFGFGSVRGFAG
jgi:hypothetical protein